MIDGVEVDVKEIAVMGAAMKIYGWKMADSCGFEKGAA
jgi:hypothetical protein